MRARWLILYFPLPTFDLIYVRWTLIDQLCESNRGENVVFPFSHEPDARFFRIPSIGFFFDFDEYLSRGRMLLRRAYITPTNLCSIQFRSEFSLVLSSPSALTRLHRGGAWSNLTALARDTFLSVCECKTSHSRAKVLVACANRRSPLPARTQKRE